MLLFYLLFGTYAGQIDVLEYSLDYLNIGYTRQLTFVFKTQSGLGTGGYLGLNLPFTLEQTLTGVAPQGVTVLYNEVSSTDCSPISLFSGNIYKDSNGWYHIQFLDLDKFPTILKANTYYQIQITTTQAMQNQIAQINKPVEAITLQDYTQPLANWIVYDNNRAFAQLEFTAAPPTTLVATANILSTTPTLLDFRYSVQLIITPTVAILRSAMIQIRMIDSDYQFQGFQCTSMSYPNATNASQIFPAQSNSQYSCSVQNNIVQINLFSLFNSTLSFKISVKNPKFVKNLGGGFEILTMNSYANNIIEAVKIINILQTSQLTWGTSNANIVNYFSFNLKMSDITVPVVPPVMNLPPQMGIYKSNSDNPFYNSFKITFYPALDTPLNLKLSVQLLLTADLGSKVLEGSISENLPQFDLNPVKCTLSATPQIQCDNVGTLTSDSVYYITFKMMFPTTATGTLNSNFGMITVQSLSNGIVFDTIPILPQARDPKAVWTLNTYTTFASQQATNGYTMVHTQPFASAQVAVSQSNYGVQYASYEQNIIFTINTDVSSFVSGLTPEYGVDCFTSPQFKLGTSNIKASYTPTSTFIFSTPNGKIEVGTRYTRIRIAVPTITDTSIFYSTPVSDKQFGIGPIIIQNNGTQFSGDSLIDYFCYSGYNLYANPTTGSLGTVAIKTFIANGYTMSTPNTLSSLYMTMANYWTGNAAPNSLNGNTFPAFIRITGTLNQLQVNNIERIAIFFTHLICFDSGTSPEGKTYCSCSSSMNTNQQCIRYYGDDTSTQSIYHLSRIEFFLGDFIRQSGPASPFQLIVPVQTIPKSVTATSNTIFLQVATVQISQNTKIYSIIQDVKSQFYQNTFTTTNTVLQAQAATITAQNYQAQYSASNQVGSTNQQIFINYLHTDSGTTISPNSGSLQGAGFFFQTQFNMAGSQFQITGPVIPKSATYGQLCLPYSYWSNYGFFCPYSTGVISSTTASQFKVSGFNFPSSNINIPIPQYAGWSTNDGRFMSSSTDNRALTLTPGRITQTTNTIIQKGYQDQIITWQFITTNSIPQDGYVLINFVGAVTWPFTVDNSAKCILMPSLNATFKTHTCVISSVINSQIKFQLTATSAFLPDTYTIYQYGVSQPSTTSSPISYAIRTYTNGGVQIDAAQNNFALNYNNSPVAPTIAISSVYFQYLNQNLRGKFNMSFTLSQRGINYNQRLSIDLTMLQGINQYSAIQCMVLENKQTSFDFKSIDGTTFSSILIYPVSDIAPGKLYTFQCQNVITPATYVAPIVYLQTASGAALSVSTGAPTLTILAAPQPIPTQGFTIKKYIAMASAMITLELQLSLSFQFVAQSAIYINLPVYYNSYDNNNSLTCSMSQVDAFCEYISERTIKLKLFTQNIQSFNTFIIDITGIIQPSQTYASQLIYVMADLDNDPTNITLFGTINDVVPTQTDSTPNNLIVSDFTISDTSIRVSSTYTYYIQNPMAIQVGQYLYIDFPSGDYGKLVQLKPPSSCSITQWFPNATTTQNTNSTQSASNSTTNGTTTNTTINATNSTNTTNTTNTTTPSASSTVYASQCVPSGNRIQIPFQLNVPAGGYMMVQLVDMTNMEASSCYIGLPTILIVSADKSSINQIATKVRANINQFKFQTVSNWKYTYWYQEEDRIDMSYTIQSIQDPNILRLNYQGLKLIPGQYSNIISLGQINAGYNKLINFTLTSNAGQFQAINNLFVYPGDGKLITKLGCSGSTNPQNYYLFFSKQESLPIQYSNVGILGVTVVNQITYISAQYDTYIVPTMLSSLPIILDFTDFIPFDPLLLDLDIVPNNISFPPGLVFADTQQSKTTLQVNTTSYVLSTIITSTLNITNITSDYEATINITFSGISANYYAQLSPITLILTTPNNLNKVDLIMNLTQLSSYSYKQIVTFTSTGYGVIYYHVVRLNGTERNLSYVQAKVLAKTPHYISDYQMEQFGRIIIQNDKIVKQINEIKARTWYKIKSWIVDIYNNTNETDYVQFVTQNNNGRLMKLNFYFKTDVDVTTKTNISCWLCSTFAYPCNNVKSFDDLSCNTVDSFINFNSTASYNDYRMLSTVNSTVYSIAYYFIPNSDLPSDKNWGQVFNGTINNDFLTWYVGNLTNSTKVISYDPLQELVFSDTPSLTSSPTFTRGSTWLSLSNIVLRDDGLIWAYIVPIYNSSVIAPNSQLPTNIQIKYHADCLNQSVNSSYFFIKSYTKGQDSVSINFTNLNQSKWYNVYMIATVDDPSLWAETSYVYSYTNKTLRDSFKMPDYLSSLLLTVLFLY